MHTIPESTIQPALFSHLEMQAAVLNIIMLVRISECHEVGSVSSLGTKLPVRGVIHLPTVSGISF